MNKRWEQISQRVTSGDNTGGPLFSAAGSVFRAFPSKDPKPGEQREHSLEILELSP